MPTPVFATSFAHQIVAASGGTVVPAASRLWVAVSGTPTWNATGGRYGQGALRINQAGAAQWVGLAPPAATRRSVGAQWIKFATLPSGGTGRLIALVAAGATAGIGVNTSGNFIGHADAASPVTGPACVAGRWYLIEWNLNTDAATHTLDWRINGEAQTQATFAGSAEDITAIRTGNTLAATDDYEIEALVLSATAADYPLGPFRVYGLLPDSDADITQVGSGAFVTAGGSAISGGTPAWNNLITPGDAAAASRVEQTAIDGAGYVEVGFADLPAHELGAVWGVNALAVMRADSTTATNGQAQVSDGGTLDAFTTLFDPSEATNVNRWKMITARPSGGGAWTKAAVDALTMRFGYSTDANPDPWFAGFMLEAVVPDPPDRVTPPRELTVINAQNRAVSRG